MIALGRIFLRDSLYTILALSTVFIGFSDRNIGQLYNSYELMIAFLLTLSFFSMAYYSFTLLLKISNKNTDKVQLIIPALVYLFFTYSYFCDDIYIKLSDVYGLKSIPFSWVWLILGTICLLLYGYILKYPLVTAFTRTVIVFTFFSQVIFYSYHLYSYYNSEHNHQKSFINAKSFGTLEKKPNVYFLLIDGYPNPKILATVTGFNNTDFEQKLKNRGFTIPDNSFSNYHFTLASVSSQLMADYHARKLTPPAVFSQMIAGDNNTVQTFKKNGYKFIFSPSGIYSELESRGLEDVYLGKYYSKEIYHALLNMTILRKYRSYFIKSKYAEPADIQGFLKADNIMNKSPYFLYAHFMQVHDLMVTENGNLVSGKSMTIQNRTSQTFLVDSIKSMNSKLLTLIDHILEYDNNAFIILNSDHGICTGRHPQSSQEESDRSWNEWGVVLTNDQVKNRFKNFSAFLMPKNIENKEALHLPRISNVNIFRYVFRALGVKNLPILEDKAFLFDYNDSEKSYYLHKEVTDTLTSEGT